MEVSGVRTQFLISLPELGSLISSQSLPCPLLTSDSPLHLLLAVFKVTLTLGRLHKALPDEVQYFAVIANNVICVDYFGQQ
jgi:hypothetical protein